MAARSSSPIFTGDFEQARAVSQEFLNLEGPRQPSVGVWVSGAAYCDLMLGQPEAALTTIAQLDDFDFPHNDGTDVRAIARLMLGNIDVAIEHIRRHSSRSVTGRYSREANDSILLFATLAHHEADDDAARRFMMVMGAARTPATTAYSRHLARQLGIIDEYLADVATLNEPGNPHGPMGTTRSMNALRTELIRRGWD